MMLCGKRCNESELPTHLLGEISRIGTWNVRSLYEVGKTEVIAKIKHYKIMFGLCENIWKGAGKRILNKG